MTRFLIPALVATCLTAQSAAACDAEDVATLQGPLVAAVQALLVTDPAKAQEIVATMQKELDAANAAGDDDAVCEMMTRLTAEAQG